MNWLVQWLEHNGRSVAFKTSVHGVAHSDWPRRVPRFLFLLREAQAPGGLSGNEPLPGPGAPGQASVLQPCEPDLVETGGHAGSCAFSVGGQAT